MEKIPPAGENFSLNLSYFENFILFRLAILP
jgi:hypothetical protein